MFLEGQTQYETNLFETEETPVGVVEGPAFEGGGVGQLLFDVAILTLTVIAAWRVFVKAGQPGWGVLIPFYNLYLICKIARRPGWWDRGSVDTDCESSLRALPRLGRSKGILEKCRIWNRYVLSRSRLRPDCLGFGSAQYNGRSSNRTPTWFELERSSLHLGSLLLMEHSMADRLASSTLVRPRLAWPAARRPSSATRPRAR